MTERPVTDSRSAFNDEHRQRLLLRARGGRALTPEDVIEVMYLVEEITPELLVEIKGFFQENDIVYDDDPIMGDLGTEDGRERVAARAGGRRKKVDPAKVAAEAMAKASGSADPVKMYLKEIGRVPLLDASEEVSLAKRIEAGAEASVKIHDLFVNDEWDSLDGTQQRMLRRPSGRR